MPKTVVYVIGSLNVGGTERHLVQVLPRLNRDVWRPVVYCLTDRGALADQLERSGISVVCSAIASPPATFSRPRRLARIARSVLALKTFMRSQRPAIAHFFLPAAYFLGAPAAILAGVPVRVMSRRSLNDYQNGHRLSAEVEFLLHRGMTAVLGNSRRVVEQLRIDEHVALGKLGLIYNGVDLPPCRNSGERTKTRASFGIHPEALVFVAVANLIPYKGHRDLLAAFGLASRHLPHGWRLLIVGRDDGIEDDLRQQASALGIAANVEFLGSRRDVHDILACADVNLLSSHQEGFSNAVLEGMAAGLPSIVTDVGGNPEAVVHGECGLVVPPNDPESFAAAIEKLSADPDLRAAMGRNARLRVERHFSIDACVARYESLYDGLVSGRKPIEIDGVGIG